MAGKVTEGLTGRLHPPSEFFTPQPALCAPRRRFHVRRNAAAGPALNCSPPGRFGGARRPSQSKNANNSGLCSTCFRTVARRLSIEASKWACLRSPRAATAARRSPPDPRRAMSAPIRRHGDPPGAASGADKAARPCDSGERSFWREADRLEAHGRRVQANRIVARHPCAGDAVGLQMRDRRWIRHN
jgi:hypothetical protein